MAISRHKVLSEMQQQLELASSKCGNLQKQLEIVKDKVRQSSTTNLVQREPPDEKENKMKNGEVLENLGVTERNQEYQHVMSLSSSSTEDINEERDVNIIKVFYDRLGQMDYPTGHVELSDISSEENDLDIDQLLSSVNFSISNNEKTENEKRKEKRSDKKAKEKAEKTLKRKKPKGKTLKAPLTSPYESHLTKSSRQSPLKIKNQRNKISLKPSVDNSQSGFGSDAKPISRGQASKTEAGKLKKRRQASGGSSALTKNGGKQVFQEPIKRVMTLASELRKTKSSTGAQRKDIFTDTRSLTRLQSDALEEKKQGTNKPENCFQDINNRPDKITSKQAPRLANEIGKMKVQATPKGKQYVAPNKGPVRIIRNNAVPKRTEEVKLKKEAPLQATNIMKDKGTSLSDLAKISAVKTTQDSKNNIAPPEIVQNVATPNKIGGTIIPALKSKGAGKVADKSIGGKVNSTGVAEKKSKPEIKLEIVKNAIPKQVDTKRIETNNDSDKTKNGIIPHLLPATEGKFVKSDVRQKVNLFEGTPGPTEVLKKTIVSKARSTASTVTRTNSRGTLYDGPTNTAQDELRRFPSVNNLSSVLPVVQEEHREKDNGDISPLTISQIRRMKDNVMKFNAIPFIVGQSTAKSYHIGLNIQQTYSLFKQTPSMTALKVSRFVDNDQHSIHSRGRSTRTGYTGRSLSTVRGRETCPACGPAPDPSPEQLADPWAVPQDDDRMVIRVCTCLPKRIISFDQVLNQLYFTDMNPIKLHPSLLPSKDGASEENEDIDGREKTATLPHRGTNTLYYTKLLRSIQNLKDNILG